MGLGSIKAVSVTPPHAQTFDAIYPGTSQAVSHTSGSSTQSSAFQNVTTAGAQQVTSVIQVLSTQPCFVAVGANPTAAANTGGLYLPANVFVKLAVNPGDKIAAISVSTSGTLYVTEGA